MTYLKDEEWITRCVVATLDNNTNLEEMYIAFQVQEGLREKARGNRKLKVPSLQKIQSIVRIVKTVNESREKDYRKTVRKSLRKVCKKLNVAWKTGNLKDTDEGLQELTTALEHLAIDWETLRIRDRAIDYLRRNREKTAQERAQEKAQFETSMNE